MSHRKKAHDSEDESPNRAQAEGQVDAEEAQPIAEEDGIAELKSLGDRIAYLERELEAATAERLRIMADFQNLRRRGQQEIAALRQFATENLVAELLPVLDNFERTVEHLKAGASPESMLEGIRLVERQLRSALESQNVRRIPAVGATFDPVMHEAIELLESEEHEHDTVVQELEPGYKMGEKVIRPARVKVSKRP